VRMREKKVRANAVISFTPGFSQGYGSRNSEKPFQRFRLVRNRNARLKPG